MDSSNSIYFIKFNNNSERIDLFNFFIENGFVICKYCCYITKSTKELENLWPVSIVSVGSIDVKNGYLMLWNPNLAQPPGIEINHDAPPQVFYDLVLQYRKKANLSLEVKLNGKVVYDEVPF